MTPPPSSAWSRGLPAWHAGSPAWHAGSPACSAGAPAWFRSFSPWFGGSAPWAAGGSGWLGGSAPCAVGAPPRSRSSPAWSGSSAPRLAGFGWGGQRRVRLPPEPPAVAAQPWAVVARPRAGVARSGGLSRGSPGLHEDAASRPHTLRGPPRAWPTTMRNGSARIAGPLRRPARFHRQPSLERAYRQPRVRQLPGPRARRGRGGHPRVREHAHLPGEAGPDRERPLAQERVPARARGARRLSPGARGGDGGRRGRRHVAGERERGQGAGRVVGPARAQPYPGGRGRRRGGQVEHAGRPGRLRGRQVRGGHRRRRPGSRDRRRERRPGGPARVGEYDGTGGARRRRAPSVWARSPSTATGASSSRVRSAGRTTSATGRSTAARRPPSSSWGSRSELLSASA
jgi:hypothetical protein